MAREKKLSEVELLNEISSDVNIVAEQGESWKRINIKEHLVEKKSIGTASGIASLDENGKIPEEQLPEIKSEIPEVASEDEGKILRVVNGQPAWVSLTNAEEESF